MKRPQTLAKMAMLGLAAAAFALPAAALAQDSDHELEANLGAMNGSGASGSASVWIDGDQLTVSLTTSGVSAGVPHAQHIHVGGEGVCPPMSASGDDDLTTTVEGVPFYGMVRLSLTTEGDVSADSALAVDRFPTEGAYTYERTFDLPEGVTAEEVMSGVVVVHGFAGLGGDPNAYDGDAVSPLDESLPLEATLPVLCGELMAVNTGGDTDDSDDGDVDNMAPPATGTGLAPADDGSALSLTLAGSLAAAVAAAGGLTLVARKRAMNS